MENNPAEGAGIPGWTFVLEDITMIATGLTARLESVTPYMHTGWLISEHWNAAGVRDLYNGTNQTAPWCSINPSILSAVRSHPFLEAQHCFHS